MRNQVWKGALILLLCLPLALSCSKKNPTRPQEEGSGGGAVATVSLTSDKLQLKPDGADQARLQATVKDASGKGVPKVIVHFTSKLGSGVTLAPDSSLTDSAGQAISTLRSTTAGLDTLTASVGSVSGKIRINYSNFTLVIDSLSQTVPPGQGTLVRATLKNAGTPVLGRRLAYSVSASRGAQIREQPPYSWTTDSGGHARAFYVAGNTTGFDTVCVTDSALSLTGQNFISVGGGSSEDTIPATILIQKVTSYFLVVRGGGGIETSEITILVLNRNGTPIKKSVRVDFSFVQPLGGGEFFAPSSGWTSLTDGTLTTVLNSGYRSGTLKFIATVFGTTVRTHPTLVMIRNGHRNLDWIKSNVLCDGSRHNPVDPPITRRGSKQERPPFGRPLLFLRKLPRHHDPSHRPLPLRLSTDEIDPARDLGAGGVPAIPEDRGCRV